MTSTDTVPGTSAASPTLPPSGQIQPYLNFDGRGAEAIEFYQKTLGAKVVQLVRFKDGPPQPDNPHAAQVSEKIMHCTMVVKGSVLHATDGYCTNKGGFAGINLSLTLPDVPEAHATFEALARGGKVQQPMSATFFSEGFGILSDRFGVTWMVLVAPKT